MCNQATVPSVSFTSRHRRPKLTKREVILFNIDANVQREKRDIFTADIYYYNAKRDLRPAAYGGVVLQRFEFIKVCMVKNGNPHYS